MTAWEYRPPQALLTGRRQGKTTELVDWLVKGKKIDKMPGWSRVLLVADEARVQWTLRNFRKQDLELQARGFKSGLQSLIYRFDAPNRQYFINNVEFAIDDLDDFLSQYFYRLPAVFSMTADTYVREPDLPPLPPKGTWL
jgi:hypothetical protein